MCQLWTKSVDKVATSMVLNVTLSRFDWHTTLKINEQQYNVTCLWKLEKSLRNLFKISGCLSLVSLLPIFKSLYKKA